jgi:hypothetical protein
VREEVPPSFLTLDEPWDEAVDGHELLQEIYGTIRRYVFIAETSALACALWVLFAHTHDARNYSPRLLIHSPELRCGKTTLLKLLAALCPKALVLVSITPGTVFRLTNKYHPTLLHDEGDAMDKATLNQLRGIMNSGHEGDRAKEVKLYSVWSPKAIARIGIEGVHPTEIDRSILIPMTRKTKLNPTERLPKGIRASLVHIRPGSYLDRSTAGAPQRSWLRPFKLHPSHASP